MNIFYSYFCISRFLNFLCPIPLCFYPMPDPCQCNKGLNSSGCYTFPIKKIDHLDNTDHEDITKQLSATYSDKRRKEGLRLSS